MYTYIYIRATTRRCKERVHMHEQGSPHAERVRLENTHLCNSYICMCKGHPMLNEHRLEKVRSSNYQNPGTSTYPCIGKERGGGLSGGASASHFVRGFFCTCCVLRLLCSIRSASLLRMHSSHCLEFPFTSLPCLPIAIPNAA